MVAKAFPGAMSTERAVRYWGFYAYTFMAVSDAELRRYYLRMPSISEKGCKNIERSES